MSHDLLLINPGGGSTIYQGLARDVAAMEPPLWCRLIGSYIRDKGHDVRILDANAENLSASETAVNAVKQSPVLICVVVHGHQPSASTQSMESAGAICRAIKTIDHGIPIILVGGHVAALPERTLREEDVDFACSSEGPVTVLGLLEAIKSGSSWESVPGLVFRDGDAIRVNPAPPLLDLSDLKGDVWYLLPMNAYRAHNWQVLDGSPRQSYASIYTSLSCPFSCSFCMIDAPFRASESRRYRTRMPADVINEIDFLHRMYGTKTFKIVDEMFVLSPNHYVPICEGLAAKPYASELNIWAYARVDTVKEGHLPLLRRAGIRWLALGIESGSAHVRDGADKAFSDEDIVSTVLAIQAAGINVIGNFIYGLKDDTAESMQATLDLALELRCEFSNHYAAMPYPGSRLFDETPVEHLPDSWAGYSHQSYITKPLPTDTLSAADVLRFRDYAFNRCFTDSGYLEHIEKKFGLDAVTQINRMVGYKLPRKLTEVAA